MSRHLSTGVFTYYKYKTCIFTFHYYTSGTYIYALSMHFVNNLSVFRINSCNYIQFCLNLCRSLLFGPTPGVSKELHF